MRESPMEAEINPKYAEDVKSREKKNDAGPTEEPWDYCKCGYHMDSKKTVDVVRLPSHQTWVERG